MHPERLIRFERRPRFRTRRRATPSTALGVTPVRSLDHRSMRVLEVGMAGVALGVAGLLSFAEPTAQQSLGATDALAIGVLLYIVALVSLIR